MIEEPSKLQRYLDRLPPPEPIYVILGKHDDYNINAVNIAFKDKKLADEYLKLLTGPTGYNSWEIEECELW